MTYPEYIDIPIDLYNKIGDGGKFGDFTFCKLAYNYLLILPDGYEYRDYPQSLTDRVRFVPVMTATK